MSLLLVPWKPECIVIDSASESCISFKCLQVLRSGLNQHPYSKIFHIRSRQYTTMGHHGSAFFNLSKVCNVNRWHLFRCGIIFRCGRQEWYTITMSTFNSLLLFVSDVNNFFLLVWVVFCVCSSTTLLLYPWLIRWKPMFWHVEDALSECIFGRFSEPGCTQFLFYDIMGDNLCCGDTDECQRIWYAGLELLFHPGMSWTCWTTQL